MDAGLSERDLNKVQRVLGPGALQQIKENPYVLARLLPLNVVDGVAKKLRVPLFGNPQRGVALAEYLLDKALLDGHCYVHVHTLLQEARYGCKLTDKTFTEKHLGSRLIVEDRYAMLPDIHAAETFVARRVTELLARRDVRNISVAAGAQTSNEGMLVRDVDQDQAIRQLRFEPISVVTGAPGTGKTTCTTVALDYFDANQISYALCAPTGKAARRLSEVTGRRASTIHRLLEWRPSGFVHNQHAPVQVDVVIVDEASMLDIRLAADLLAAIDPTRTRIAFIGDVNQLPPVGPGAFFSDLIDSGLVPIVRLTTLHRAAANSWICRNAPKILAGKGVELDADVPDYDWYEMKTKDAANIKNVAADVIRKLQAEGLSWDDFQLLTPMKIKTGGAFELNTALREALISPQGLTTTIGAYETEATVTRGDRVIQMRNDYELNIFNGETGQIALVDGPDSVKVRFDEEYRVVKGARLKNMALAYALTTHKFQGSQCGTVIVICHSVHGRMLNRRLFYTAVTRARKKVILIGDADGVKQAIANTQDQKRRTRLIDRISGKL